MTFAAETLLFAGLSANRTTSTAGTSGWSITYRFMYRPSGWNKFAKVKAMTGNSVPFASVYSDGTELKLYEAVSFNGLF